MKHPLLAPIALTTIALAVHAAPARLPYQPAHAPSEPPQIQLGGTTWKGACYDIPCWITFEPGGKLTYRTQPNNMITGSPGFWRLTGNQLFFEIAQYSEHRGTIVGDSVQGDSTNKANMRARFQLQRLAPGE